MENISVAFASVKAPDAVQYLADRISSLHYANQQLFVHEPEKSVESVSQAYAAEMLKSVEAGVTIPLSAQLDMTSLIGDNADQIRGEYACMIKEVKTTFPLLANEIAESYEAAYLTGEYDGHPAKSAVLKQTTNYSECYYIYPYIAVEVISITSAGTNIKLLYDMPSEEEPKLLSAPTLKFSFSDLPIKIAEGLAKTIGSKVGAMVLNEVWPSSETVKVDLEKIGAVVEKVVATELTRNNVNQAVVQLTAYMKDLNTEYLARKKNEATNSELFEYLKAKDDRLKYDMVSVFQYTPLSGYNMESVTYSHFLLGASVHLAHLQEKASLKPDAQEKSVVTAWAKAYIQYAKEAIPRVAEARVPFISSGLYRIDDVKCTVRGDCSTTSGYEFKDDYNGYYKRELYSKKTKDAVHDRMARARFDYISGVKNGIIFDLTNKSDRVFAAWKKLENNPLP